MNQGVSKLLKVPSIESLDIESKEALQLIRSKIGFIPNVYRVFAYSPRGFKRFINFNNAESSLSHQELELVNLTVSEINKAYACLATHTAAASSLGFSEKEIIAIRAGRASFDSKLCALANLCKAICQNSTNAVTHLDNFFEAGYSKENLVDLILAITAKTCTHLMYNISEAEADFPPVAVLNSFQS